MEEPNEIKSEGELLDISMYTEQERKKLRETLLRKWGYISRIQGGTPIEKDVDLYLKKFFAGDFIEGSDDDPTVAFDGEQVFRYKFKNTNTNTEDDMDFTNAMPINSMEKVIPVEVEGSSIKGKVTIKPSKKHVGDVLLSLEADFKDVHLRNTYRVNGQDQESISKAPALLSHSIVALHRISQYRNYIENNEKEKTVTISFDDEILNKYAEESSIRGILENMSEDISSLTEDIDLSKPEDIASFADKLDLMLADFVTLVSKKNTAIYTLQMTGKNDNIVYISQKDPEVSGGLIFLNGNLTGDLFARSVSEIKQIDKTIISDDEKMYLEASIFYSFGQSEDEDDNEDDGEEEFTDTDNVQSAELVEGSSPTEQE
jgi:hypothetical protein